MGMPKFPPTVPIGQALPVGDPFKLVNHYPTVVVQCQCEKKAILILIGSHNIVTCPACRNQYVLGDMVVDVSAMRPKSRDIEVVQ